VINEMNTNSVITTPGHNDFLPINAITTQRTYTMKGFAYSGNLHADVEHHHLQQMVKWFIFRCVFHHRIPTCL
jgi:hypothetical protein